MIAVARSSGIAIAFQGVADLRAEGPDRVVVIGTEECQPIEAFVDRRRFSHDPPEGIRRHAEAGWHADAVDPRELAEACTLATDHRCVRVVDLLESEHVAAHLPTIPSGPARVCLSQPWPCRPCPDRLVTCIVNTPLVLAARPPPWCTVVLAVGVCLGWDGVQMPKSARHCHR